VAYKLSKLTIKKCTKQDQIFRQIEASIKHYNINYSTCGLFVMPIAMRKP